MCVSVYAHVGICIIKDDMHMCAFDSVSGYGDVSMKDVGIMTL